MSQRDPDWLPLWQPPAGGLRRLLARRDAAQRPSWHRRWLLTGYAPLLAGATAAVLMLLLQPAPLPVTSAGDRLLGVAAQGATLQVLDEATLAQQLPTRQPGVRLYWTESLRVASEVESAQAP